MNNATNLILSKPEKYEEDFMVTESVHKLAELGFKLVDSIEALKQNDFVFENALKLLEGGNFSEEEEFFYDEEKEEKNSNNSNNIDFKEPIIPLEKHLSELKVNEESPMLHKLLSPSTNFTEKNFFIELVNFLKDRVQNFTKFCVVCSRRHSCNSDIGVVCCEPLCVFSYEEMKIVEYLDTKVIFIQNYFFFFFKKKFC